MIRTIAILVVMGVLASAHSAPFQAGGPKKTQPPAPPTDPRPIIEQIDKDFGNTVDRLTQKDPGVQTRENQQRILEGLDKLIQQQNPNHRPPSASNPPPPKKPAGPPPVSAANPAPKQPPAAQKTPAGKVENRATTPPAAPKEKHPVEAWPNLPPRLRAEMDAFAREGYPARYQRLIGAYFRSVAENHRRDD